jgi:hypothetical protein
MPQSTTLGMLIARTYCQCNRRLFCSVFFFAGKLRGGPDRDPKCDNFKLRRTCCQVATNPFYHLRTKGDKEFRAPSYRQRDWSVLSWGLGEEGDLAMNLISVVPCLPGKRTTSNINYSTVWRVFYKRKDCESVYLTVTGK